MFSVTLVYDFNKLFTTKQQVSEQPPTGHMSLGFATLDESLVYISLYRLLPLSQCKVQGLKLDARVSRNIQRDIGGGACA